ncbi:Apolipoprotein N-acyltransferase [Candidatus Hepatincola sp. Pdp]
MIIKNFFHISKKKISVKFQQPLFNNIILFVVSGCFVLGFAPFNYVIIAMLALIITTFCLLQSKCIQDVLIKSYIISCGFSIFGFYWIVNSSMYIFHNYLLALLILGGFTFLYTCFIFPSAYLIYKAPKQGYLLYIYVFVAWWVADILKEYLFGGLPWFRLSYLWTENLYILQNVAVFGTFGLSFITLGLITGLFFAINSTIGGYKRFLPLSIMLFIFGILWFYGWHRVHSRIHYFGKTISLRLVQPNISQADKLNPEKVLHNFYNTINLTFANINDKNLDYIVLPEVAFSFILENYPNLYNQLIKKIPPKTKLIMGALRVENNQYFNSAYILDKQGNRLAYYDKKKLVPFGEYIPFSKYLPFLSTFTGVSNLTQGYIDNTIILDEFSFVALICFEGVFDSTNMGVSKIDFLLNLSNEGWFDESIEISQNLAMYKVRAIETGVTSIKVSNRGPSVIINGLGQITQTTEAYSQQVLDAKFKLEKRQTLYANINNKLMDNFIIMLSGLLYVIMLGLGSKRKFSYA